MKKIAVTGGVASGKSTVCRLFKKLGAYVVDSDEIVHNALSPNTTLGKKVVSLLGSDVLENGHFDRKKIAEKVFKEPKKLQELEHLIHPFVLHEIESQYKAVQKQNSYPLFVAEIPLLYEIGVEGSFDYIVVVLADSDKCKTRLASKGTSPHDYERRMQRQLSPQEKAGKADFVLSNDGTLEELETQVQLLFQKLLS